MLSPEQLLYWSTGVRLACTNPKAGESMAGRRPRSSQNSLFRFRGYSSIAFVENNARIAMQRRLCNYSNGFTRMEETPLYYLAIISLNGNRRRRGHFPDAAG
jgi:hypothetical protein